jgi:hypothetical protein
VRKPDYSGLLALRGSDVLDPDYDPSGPYGLTPEALARRGWNTFEEARIAVEKQADDLLAKPVATVAKPGTASRQKAVKKSQVADA